MDRLEQERAFLRGLGEPHRAARAAAEAQRVADLIERGVKPCPRCGVVDVQWIWRPPRASFFSDGPVTPDELSGLPPTHYDEATDWTSYTVECGHCGATWLDGHPGRAVWIA